jgi:hypothetical protein
MKWVIYRMGSCGCMYTSCQSSLLTVFFPLLEIWSSQLSLSLAGCDNALVRNKMESTWDLINGGLQSGPSYMDCLKWNYYMRKSSFLLVTFTVHHFIMLIWIPWSIYDLLWLMKTEWEWNPSRNDALKASLIFIVLPVLCHKNVSAPE